jgi:hypothetical protein
LLATIRAGEDFMQRKAEALIVVPENNTTMEAEISALCPALAPMPVARVKRPRAQVVR